MATATVSKKKTGVSLDSSKKVGVSKKKTAPKKKVAPKKLETTAPEEKAKAKPKRQAKKRVELSKTSIKHVGGGWYQLPDGTRVQGKAEATKLLGGAAKKQSAKSKTAAKNKKTPAKKVKVAKAAKTEKGSGIFVTDADGKKTELGERFADDGKLHSGHLLRFVNRLSDGLEVYEYVLTCSTVCAEASTAAYIEEFGFKKEDLKTFAGVKMLRSDCEAHTVG